MDSQYRLGKMLFNGDGIAENAELAAKWFEKAAIQGNAQAQNELALQYLDGVGIQKNEALAAEWFEKAAKQDNIDASLNLGLMYKNGRGIPWNENLAVKWLQKAANSHNTNAQYNLACIYFEGKSGAKNINLALQMFEKSATQGNADAQAYLGIIYLFGRNVPKNESLALKFLNQAAQQGHPTALKCLADRQKSIERQQFKSERAEINRKLKHERELALAALIEKTKNEIEIRINDFKFNYNLFSGEQKINKEHEIKVFAINKKSEIEKFKINNEIKDYASEIDLDKFEDDSLIKIFWKQILQIQQSSSPYEQMKELNQMLEGKIK
jgi:TPR repeat protein